METNQSFGRKISIKTCYNMERCFILQFLRSLVLILSIFIIGPINSQDSNYKERLKAYKSKKTYEKVNIALDILNMSDISDSLRNTLSKEILSLSNDLSDTLYGMALNHRGIYYYKTGFRDSAMWYYKKAVQRLKGTSKEKYNCIIYDNMALACLFTENAPIARKYLDTATIVLSKFPDSFTIKP